MCGEVAACASCRGWRDAALLVQPEARLAFHQLGHSSVEQEVLRFKEVLHQPRYAAGGGRPLCGLTLSSGHELARRRSWTSLQERSPTSEACPDSHQAFPVVMRHCSSFKPGHVFQKLVGYVTVFCVDHRSASSGW